MNKTTTITRERTGALENASVEISKVSMGVVAITATLIGCWAVACLVSAMVSNGGPAGLLKGFITAITG